MTKNVGYKPKSAYKCKQDELYAICILAWNSCKKKITDFVALKALYTLQFITNAVNEVIAASSIADAQSRINVAEYIRLDLADKANQCIAKWQLLKLYITQAFPADELKMRLEDAGASLFKQASAQNWEKLSKMMNKGAQFITANLTQLQADNNMPAAFKTQYDQLITDATALYVQYQSAIDDATEITTQKVNANNAVHAKLMLMLKDGQQIYRNDQAKRNEFIFTHILERVRSVANEYKEFTIAANSSEVIDNIVNNSLFTNTGSAELVVCNGDVTCTVGNGTTVLTGATIIIQEGVNTITVLNTDATKAGKCRVRVTKS